MAPRLRPGAVAWVLGFAFTLAATSCTSGAGTAASGTSTPAVHVTAATPITSSTAAPSSSSTTTTLVDPRSLPGHHLGPIPDAEIVQCPDAEAVPMAGEAVAVAGFDDRPTVLQRAADPAAPLVVVFHGQHGCVQNVQSRSDLDVIGPAAGVHVLWLSGQALPTRSWNVNGRCCEPASDRDVDELPYVEAALATARALGISSATVLAVGVSNGGGMAVTAACRRPQLFTGVVVIAGWMPVTCHPAAQSLLVFGGSLDENLGSRRAAQVATLWRTDVAACPGEPIVENAGPRATTTWLGCAGGAMVRLVQLDGVPHVWPKFDFYDIDDEIILLALGRFSAA